MIFPFDMRFTPSDHSGKIHGTSIRCDGWYMITVSSMGLTLIGSVGFEEDGYFDVDEKRRLKVIGVDILI